MQEVAPSRCLVATDEVRQRQGESSDTDRGCFITRMLPRLSWNGCIFPPKRRYLPRNDLMRVEYVDLDADENDQERTIREVV